MLLVGWQWANLIHYVMKAPNYYFENFIHKQEHELVDGVTKSILINNKVFALRSMLAGQRWANVLQ